MREIIVKMEGDKKNEIYKRYDRRKRCKSCRKLPLLSI